MSLVKIIQPAAGPPFTSYNSSSLNAYVQQSRKHKMNDLKTTSVRQKLYKNSTREGQVSLVSTHDVTNPPVHCCNWSLVYFCFQNVENNSQTNHEI